MKTAVLRGHETTLIGETATIAEARSAIALSRGGAAKTYDYKDPNEDACAFAFSDDAILLAVADGHGGSAAAPQILERLLDAHAPAWLASQAPDLAEHWAGIARDVVLDLNALLLAPLRRGEEIAGRSTFTAVLIRPADDLLLALSVGDSHAFRVDDDGVRELCARGDERLVFLGNPAIELENVGRVHRSEVHRGARHGAVVLATDGLSEQRIGVEDPSSAVAACIAEARSAGAELRAVNAARGLVECALDAHRSNRSGDNIATAIAWLED